MDDIFEKIDKSFENVNDDENRDKSFRRYCYTWNNPFFNDEFEEVDINNTDLPIDLKHYDLHNLKTDFNKEFFEFKFIKYQDYKTGEFKVIERPFFKNSDAIRNYIVNFSTFRYSCFQIEKGGNCETTHIQGFITFKNPMTWSTFKNYFPCTHFNKCISTNTYCRQYCSKTETRVEGPFEDGEFAEERSRTDAKDFVKLVQLGASDDELLETYSSLYLREFNKLDKIRNKSIFSKFKTFYRNVEVTYIYGPSRCGKSSYIAKRFGYGNFYNVDSYKYGPYDNYAGEDIIVFDEYNSQVDITLFNKLLDGHPVQLPCRFENKWACYSKVFIVSNLKIDEQYSSENVSKNIRDAFLARIHKIFRFDSFGNIFVEKDVVDHKQISISDVGTCDFSDTVLEPVDIKELDNIF